MPHLMPAPQGQGNVGSNNQGAGNTGCNLAGQGLVGGCGVDSVTAQQTITSATAVGGAASGLASIIVQAAAGGEHFQLSREPLVAPSPGICALCMRRPGV